MLTHGGEIAPNSTENCSLPLLKRFPQIISEDSSIIALPEEISRIWKGHGDRTGASHASLKLHGCFELKSGQPWGPEITEGIHSDHRSPFRNQELAQRSLKYSDLGYFDLHLLRQRQERGLFTLGWVFANVKLFDFDRQRRALSLEEIAPKEVGQARELEVLMGGRQRLPVRLLLLRVPVEVEEQRRLHLQQEAKHYRLPVSERALKLTRWTALFTDAPADRLCLQEALVLQRQRWQMKLFYKVCKQINEVDEWVSDNPWRILCECYAKLIGALLQHWDDSPLCLTEFAAQPLQMCSGDARYVLDDYGSVGRTSLLAFSVENHQGSDADGM